MFHIVVETHLTNKINNIIGNKVISQEPFFLDEYKFTTEYNNMSNKSTTQKKQQKTKNNDSILFYSGNPRVESIKGVFHLCRDNNTKKVQFINGDEKKLPDLWDTTIPEIRSDLICILSAPRWMPTNEFCKWMKQYEGVEQMRIIKASNSTYYMVIIKFHSQYHADHFYIHANSQPFNSVEPDKCYAVFVQDVKFIEPKDCVLFDNKILKELPSCPVCLERLDAEESGLITSICNHQFHSNCIAQCESENNSCPVCRYSLKSPECSNQCSDCEATDNLWICLLCGNLGCSRYKNEHAELHFQKTGHTYSLEIDTQRVWDYAGDNYVHRLIQNNTDGKLVEIPGPKQGSDDDIKGKNQKVDALIVEYNYLLTSQLESQRLYFEQREAKKDDIIHSLEEKLKSITRIVPSKVDEERNKKASDKKIAQLTSKLNKANAECDKLKEEIVFLQDINNQLVQNQEGWKKKIDQVEQKTEKLLKEKEKRLEELEGQVRDLMLHLDSSNAIAANEKKGELEEGSVISIPNRTKIKRNRNRRR